jgi:hypothetical protein
MDKDDKLRIVSAQIPLQDAAKLLQEAQRADRTLSAQIRRVVREHIEREQKESAGRSGVRS